MDRGSTIKKTDENHKNSKTIIDDILNIINPIHFFSFSYFSFTGDKLRLKEVKDYLAKTTDQISPVFSAILCLCFEVKTCPIKTA